MVVPCAINGLFRMHQRWPFSRFVFRRTHILAHYFEFNFEWAIFIVETSFVSESYIRCCCSHVLLPGNCSFVYYSLLGSPCSGQPALSSQFHSPLKQHHCNYCVHVMSWRITDVYNLWTHILCVFCTLPTVSLCLLHHWVSQLHLVTKLL